MPNKFFPGLIFAIIVFLGMSISAAKGSLCLEKYKNPDIYIAHLKSCATELGIDSEEIEEEMPNSSEIDEKKCFARCIFRKFGFLNEDGSINFDAMTADLEAHAPQKNHEEFVKIPNLCKIQESKKFADDQHTSCEYITAIDICYDKNEEKLC